MKTQVRALVWGVIIFAWVVFILAPISPITVPFEVIAYGLMAVVGSYTGIDQLAGVVASRKLPSGTKYTGNKKKLFRITMATILLTLTVIILALFFTTIPYPVATMLLSSFAVISFYVSGEKGKTAMENTGEEEKDIEDLR